VLELFPALADALVDEVVRVSVKIVSSKSSGLGGRAVLDHQARCQLASRAATPPIDGRRG
jgi:hypothetical protein